ncbi:gastrula zinc finger protein XlCGF28.1-like [Silurus asotus]|uniref:ribonuclease H n=1 Tax=Silurus asotus TaxID=30991 RepID=A0AAD5FTI0_SILAS|nr:gastrula zinc finger protein XlCGF28.1-like [Silurus asotus]
MLFVVVLQVFLIVALQLLVTTSIGAVFTFILIFLIIYELSVIDVMRRRFPGNLILLFIFTLTMSFMAGTTSSYFETKTVFLLMVMMVVVCVAVTAFSFQTKTTTIIPVPMHSAAKYMNDFCPVALTPIAMKCFEKLVLNHLTEGLSPTLDPHQFAYRPNRSTEDAVSTALHSALTHLDKSNTYIRMLFIDFISAFNTVLPTVLITKFSELDICTSTCKWILDFLTNRPQSVRLGNKVSSILILNTGIPQGCFLSPLLYSLFINDCDPLYNSNIFINNLTLNATKTKELIVDFRKSNRRRHLPVNINGTEVERVSSFKFLGVHISDDLSWQQNTSALVKKAQQRLYSLRSLKKSYLSPGVLTSFYRCIIESILTNSITVWYGGPTVCERKAVQRVVKTAQRITGTQLPAIEHLHHSRCLRRAHNIINDSSHPSHKLFNLLRSQRRYRNLRTRTSGAVALSHVQKNTPKHDATTPMLHSRDGVLGMVEFTSRPGLFCVLCIVLLITGIITAIILSLQYIKWLSMLYTALGVIFFTLFLLYNTWLLLEKQIYELKPEEYLFGALTLYTITPTFWFLMRDTDYEVRQESPWTVMFVDDIVICGESSEQVEKILERWRYTLERRGMKVSRSKTEYMCVNEREGSGGVRLQGEEVEKVEEFRYLGSTV